MRQPQFPAYGLALFVGMFACWLIAVGRPSELFTSAVFTATLGLLGFATLLAFSHRPGSRAFWRGFIICGWMYFVVAFLPMINSGETPHFLPEVMLNDLYLYATTGATVYIHELSKPVSSPRPHFVRNGHALLALLLGLGGGFVSRAIAARETPG